MRKESGKLKLGKGKRVQDRGDEKWEKKKEGKGKRLKGGEV